MAGDHGHVMVGWRTGYFCLSGRCTRAFAGTADPAMCLGQADADHFLWRAGLGCGWFLWFNTYPPRLYGELALLALGCTGRYQRDRFRSRNVAVYMGGSVVEPSVMSQVAFIQADRAPGCFAWRHVPPFWSSKLPERA